MSESERDPKTVRRAAGIVLGGIAAGTLIGGAIAAQPTPPTPPSPAAAHEPTVIPAPPSIREQFRDSFDPGPVDPQGRLPFVVISEY